MIVTFWPGIGIGYFDYTDDTDGYFIQVIILPFVMIIWEKDLYL